VGSDAVFLPGSSGTVSFKYDPFGRRIYKSSAAGNFDLVIIVVYVD